MSVSDPIADLLTRLRNGGRAKHRFVDIPWSKIKEEIVKILQEEGFVRDYRVKVENTRGIVRVYLKYDSSRRPVLMDLKRISKPGNRCYVKSNQLHQVLGGMGISIVSTSKGLCSGKKARELGVGGELLCQVS